MKKLFILLLVLSFLIVLFSIAGVQAFDFSDYEDIYCLDRYVKRYSDTDIESYVYSYETRYGVTIPSNMIVSFENLYLVFSYPSDDAFKHVANSLDLHKVYIDIPSRYYTVSIISSYDLLEINGNPNVYDFYIPLLNLTYSAEDVFHNYQSYGMFLSRISSYGSKNISSVVPGGVTVTQRSLDFFDDVYQYIVNYSLDFVYSSSDPYSVSSFSNDFSFKSFSKFDFTDKFNLINIKINQLPEPVNFAELIESPNAAEIVVSFFTFALDEIVYFFKCIYIVLWGIF